MVAVVGVAAAPFAMASGSALTTTPEPATPAAAPPAPSLAPYAGLGAWIDIFDPWAWHHPAGTMRRLDGHGVNTVFIETGNYSSNSAVMNPGGTSALIRAAHGRGMTVVAWYLPSFVHPTFDFHRSMAAIHFHKNGQRFDSFGLDIESSLVSSKAVRSRRLVALSRRIDAHVPGTYALGAIIPSPRGMQLAKGYWENFPYKGIDPHYDVWLPMGYYTYHYTGRQAAYDYTRLNSQIIWNETGDPTTPIHPIGGIAFKSSDAETRGFVDAVLDDSLIGGGLYDVGTSGPDDWPELERLSI